MQQVLTSGEPLDLADGGRAQPSQLVAQRATFTTIALEVAYGTVTVNEAVDRWFAEAETSLAE